MRRTILSVSFAAIASIAIGRLEARAPLQARDDAPVKITVIGCVERSTPIPEPGATTAVPADETRYVLSKITLVPPDRAEPTGTAGSAIEQSVSKYRLDDASASKVAQHVGDRVQITGTLGKGAKAPAAPVLRVDSVTKISSDAASCSK